MAKKASAPTKKWAELLLENRTVYAKSRPKRAEFILKYLEERGTFRVLTSFHEQGAFSGKDIKHLKEQIGSGLFFASDLDVAVASRLAEHGVNVVAGDALALPFKDESFDLTFHSGLIVCFDNEGARAIVQEQLRSTSKIAFIFAHNEYSWIDKVSSLYKRWVRKEDIFTYRRYTGEELAALLAGPHGQVDIIYYDNALLNFLGRHSSFAKRLFTRVGAGRLRCLCNEVVMVVIK